MSEAEASETEDERRLRERVRAAASVPTLDSGALFDAVRTELARETGLAARLRAWPTPARIASGLGVGLALAALAALLMMRPDAASYPRIRGLVETATLIGLLAIAVTVALRPVHRPTLAPARARMLDAAALLAVLVVALLPQVVDFHFGMLTAMATGCGCLALGALAGIAQYAALRVLDRGAPGSRFAAAAAAGLTANLVLHLHCPVGDPAHTLVGHVGASLLLLAVAGLRSARS